MEPFEWSWKFSWVLRSKQSTWSELVIKWILSFQKSLDKKKKLSENLDKYLDLTRELKKNRRTWRWRYYKFYLVCLNKNRIGNPRNNSDHPGRGIVNIGNNTDKSPGDLRRLALTQTPVKDHIKNSQGIWWVDSEKNTRTGSTVWEKKFSWNCTKNWNFKILTNGIGINHKMFVEVPVV